MFCIDFNQDVVMCASDDLCWKVLDNDESLESEWQVIIDEVDFEHVLQKRAQDMCTIHETTSESNPFVTRMENNSYHPFSNKTEWDCFMLLKYHRLTKLQYEKVTEMLKDNNIPYLTYDQIQHCVKGLQTQQLSHSTDHVFYYNLESTIRYLLADPIIANQIHYGRNITDKEKGEQYATPGFKKLIEKSGSDILSVVFVLYFDEYRKYRTGSKNSGGFYLSLLNYSKSFLTGSRKPSLF
ncbi:hypothetical protein C9374_012350 [Naegleria lovaniensis]|uniref:Uncharacterized protein n=1 Tax=Naegleria lovaniensis TaxID=51637 RepID=A0AA88G7Y4_NAELO|nr:uncharacterized protein C9374_012350 [Naegleria lovaniensis]KAG2373247.1 hypothetical protein C9374_012350 [Naegleria lovaniensis]